MHVHRPYRRALKKPDRKNLAVGYHHKEVKRGLLDEGSTLFGSYSRWLINPNSALLGKNLDRWWLRPMSPPRRPVRLSDNSRNLVGALNQRAE